MDHLELLANNLPLPTPVTKECEIERTNGIQMVSENYVDKFRELVDLRNQYAQQYAQKEGLLAPTKRWTMLYSAPCVLTCALIAFLLYYYPPRLITAPVRFMVAPPAWKNMWQAAYQIENRDFLFWGPVNLSRQIAMIATNAMTAGPILLGAIATIAQVPQAALGSSRSIRTCNKILFS